MSRHAFPPYQQVSNMVRSSSQLNGGPPLLSWRVYRRLEKLFDPLVRATADLTSVQVEEWIRSLRLGLPELWVQQVRLQSGDIVGVVLRQLIQYATGRASEYRGDHLLLEDLYKSIYHEGALQTLLSVQDPVVVLYQEVEVAIGPNSGLLSLHEETVAALALMSHRYSGGFSFSFPPTVSDRDLAVELERHRYSSTYTYKVVFSDSAAYYCDSPEFVQGINTFFSWVGNSQAYQVYRGEQGDDSLMVVL